MKKELYLIIKILILLTFSIPYSEAKNEGVDPPLNSSTFFKIKTEYLPSQLIFHPEGKFVYVVNQKNGGSISEYSYDFHSGKFTPLAPAIISTGGNGPSFGGGFDNSGKFLYILNSLSNSVSVFLLDKVSGQLTRVETIDTLPASPTAITFSPDDNYAYITLYDSNKILEYDKNSDTGRLTLLKNMPWVNTVINPILLTFSSDGAFAYIAGYLSNNVVVYTYNSLTGNLSDYYHIVNTGSGSLFLVPDGKCGYVVATNENKIYQYIIVNGKLEPSSVYPSVDTGVEPNTYITFSPDHKFAYEGNYKSNNLSQYKVNTELCQLEPLDPPMVNAEINPITVKFAPGTNYMYIINKIENSISVYTQDPITGQIVAGINGSVEEPPKVSSLNF